MLGLGAYLIIIETDEDQRKFEFIYNTYKYRMYWICNDILRDHHLAEDALQEAFLSVIKRLDVIEDVSSRRTACYVCLIAKSRAIDIYRKVMKDYRREFPIEDYGLVVYNTVNYWGETSVQAEVLDSIHALISLDRQILELYLEKQMTRKEIAILLNLKYDTVRKRINKALTKLQAELNKRGIYE